VRAGKAYVEQKTCHEWHSSFLCVDGTPSPLHKKPGWHGEGFFDKNSDYSLTAQVSIYYQVSVQRGDLQHKRSSYSLIICLLLTTSLVYLGVFMTQMYLHKRGSPSIPSHFLVWESGCGWTRHILHEFGVCRHTNGQWEGV